MYWSTCTMQAKNTNSYADVLYSLFISKTALWRFHAARPWPGSLDFRWGVFVGIEFWNCQTVLSCDFFELICWSWFLGSLQTLSFLNPQPFRLILRVSNGQKSDERIAIASGMEPLGAATCGFEQSVGAISYLGQQVLNSSQAALDLLP